MTTVAMRSNLARSLHRSLLVVLCAGLAFAGIVCALLPLGGPSGRVVILFPLVFLAYLCAGLHAWYRRPGNRLGGLILLGGFSVLLGSLINTEIPVLIAVGSVGATLVLAVTVHMLHAFPSGHLSGRLSKYTVALAYVNSLLLQAPVYLLDLEGPLPAMAIADNPGMVAGIAALQKMVGTAVMSATAFVLIRRLVRADAAHRRVLMPLFAYGAFAVVLVPFGAIVLGPVLNFSGEARAAIQLVALGGIPVAFSQGILRGGFAKTAELEELGSWLGGWGGTRSSLRLALARTVGDPTLELSFWVPKLGIFIDDDGNPVAVLPAGNNRGVVEIDLDGLLVGAITFDSTAVEDIERVRSAGQVVAIAVDRERLTADLRESHTALQRSRERLVDAADRERKRIARDLHDGLQMQLVLLALEAQQMANASKTVSDTAERATGLRRGIDAAAADLRQLVHAVMPAALIERGLVAAAEDLVDRMPVPTELEINIGDFGCPPAVESTAYFVLAESLTNAVKHAHAGAVRVELHRSDGWLVIQVQDDGIGGADPQQGTGLRGASDRVDVLGGHFCLRSEPGTGTQISVKLPCA